MKERYKILAVDDEEFNLDIIVAYLEEAGFEVLTATSGESAMVVLEREPDIDILVLDRMMPGMNGMDVLKVMNSSEKLKDIPVIMQTAAASQQQIQEGIEAGVYYYLTKPYEDTILISVVRAALKSTMNRKRMVEEVRKSKGALALIENANFRFRTLDEVRDLAYYIAGCFPEPEAAVYGITEIMINAVEHGNLGISYADKTALMMEGNWEEEVERRLSLPENQDKFAYAELKVSDDEIRLCIKDCGKGFDWNNYLDISPSRATDPHGRGIPAARRLSFDSVEYVDDGSEVICRKKL